MRFEFVRRLNTTNFVAPWGGAAKVDKIILDVNIINFAEVDKGGGGGGGVFF